MAYKNQKKNKKHSAKIRKENNPAKHYRKSRRYNRNYPHETETEALIRIGKQLGMI